MDKLSFKDFSKQFVVTDAMMADLQKLATQAKIKYSAKDYERSANYIRGQVKALVARNIWQRKTNRTLNNEYYQVLMSFDETLQKALQNFEKAEKLARGEMVETLTHSGKQ